MLSSSDPLQECPSPTRTEGCKEGVAFKNNLSGIQDKVAQRRRVVAEPGVFRHQQGKASLSAFVLCGREDIPNQTPVMRHCEMRGSLQLSSQHGQAKENSVD